MLRDDQHILRELSSELRGELVSNILPYWAEKTPDETNGGFVGRITQCDTVDATADKGAILNARILWTFAHAYRILGDASYRDVATRAYDYFVRHFIDTDYGGVFWSVDQRGRARDVRKQTYAQAFGVYGLAEFYRATRNESALAAAVHTFRAIEENCHDREFGGYHEAFGRDWSPIDDVRLSERDMNAPKNMNTHLHVLEAYATLYTVHRDQLLRQRLAELVLLFLDGRMINATTHHLVSFFQSDWRAASDFISYGHDIEASWLVLEAANVLEDEDLVERARGWSVDLAARTLSEGQAHDGGVMYESFADGTRDDDRHWWVQAEAVVGFVNAYEITGDARFARAAMSTWRFTRDHIVDRECGEWRWRVGSDGTLYDDDRVGPWKCSYHNARACLEVIQRVTAASKATLPN